jgi:nitrogen regulatory protein PII
MYNAIFVIADKGKGSQAVDAARSSGSKGATIINARGSGVHESNVIFGMDVEPEKEMVLILSDSEKTQVIVDAIKEALKIDEPGNGIIFIQEVSEAYGLYE